MKLNQFQNPNLSHFSYAILDESTRKVVLIDPARNLAPYLEWVDLHKAQISDVIETHPHADFISSHLEIAQRTRARIHVSSEFGASFAHQSFDDGDSFRLGDLAFRCIFTPGHSPDSNCIVLSILDKDYCIFTGDTLFIGDCGRPDLREVTGERVETREKLASEMYHSLRKLTRFLTDDLWVYPSHGAGSLCGRSISNALTNTLGAEKKSNWSLSNLSEELFIQTLLQDQPFTPAYFHFDVLLNQKGAPIMEGSLQHVPYLNRNEEGYLIHKEILIIDTRPKEEYNEGHYPLSFNIMEGLGFSTWLGSVVKPNEPFYLLANTLMDIDALLIQVADIGYDLFLQATITMEGLPFEKPSLMNNEILDIEDFMLHPDNYTLIDLRNPNEAKEKPIFPNSSLMPLYTLRDRLGEIATDKPIIVHCASGYRSAAGRSILKCFLKSPLPIFDLGEKVKDFYQ